MIASAPGSGYSSSVKRRTDLDRFIERLQCFLDVPGQAAECCQSIQDVIRFGLLLEKLFQMLASNCIVAGIDERHREVKMLLRRFELERRFLHMLIAGLEVDFRAIA